MLREIPGAPYALAFDVLFANRAMGEQVIRSLVTLTAVMTGTPVNYAIGAPARDTTSGLATLDLSPEPPLASNAWYRVTVNPGDSQKLVSCQTLSTKGGRILTAPETTDFFTYSRLMVSDMFVAYKDGGRTYLQVDFTEALLAADLDTYPMAVAAVDGVELVGCFSPYACAAGASVGPASLRLDGVSVPQFFTTVSLRIPHAVRSINGDTIFEGADHNPYVTIYGDWAVYTFAAADMVLTDNDAVKRWYFTGM